MDNKNFQITYIWTDELTCEITHIPSNKQYKLILSNPDILTNIEDIIDDYLKTITEQNREDVINNLL